MRFDNDFDTSFPTSHVRYKCSTKRQNSSVLFKILTFIHNFLYMFTFLLKYWTWTNTFLPFLSVAQFLNLEYRKMWEPLSCVSVVNWQKIGLCLKISLEIDHTSSLFSNEISCGIFNQSPELFVLVLCNKTMYKIHKTQNDFRNCSCQFFKCIYFCLVLCFY